jgi:Lon protease-like protein
MEIPLFPLHTVLCPGIVVPLHIFEERYRALTRHCLETGAPFGIVLIRDGREVGPVRNTLALEKVGALVEIREADRFPDGRYQLLAAATGRFAIDSVDLSRAPYLVADVTPLEDEVGDELRAERLAASAIRRFVRYLELMRIREGESGEALDIRVELDTVDLPGAPAEDDTVDLDPLPHADDDPDASTAPATASLAIPDDPTVLSYLLSGIIQVELPRR